MEEVKCLWTGGWDSTFRLVEISKNIGTIQPIYVLDPNRKSKEIEIATMKKILSALRQKEETQAIIKDLKIVKMEDIPKNDEISTAFNELSKAVTLGSQYEWLARLAYVNPGLEIGIEKPSGEYSGCMTVIDKFGSLKEVAGSYVVDPESSSEQLLKVFGNLSFPICKITETEMVKKIQSWGYEDIMKMIWFCHCPLNGKPCGVCRPCQQKMECNMEWLLPKKAQKRYHVHGKLKKISPHLASIYSIMLRKTHRN